MFEAPRALFLGKDESRTLATAISAASAQRYLGERFLTLTAKGCVAVDPEAYPFRGVKHYMEKPELTKIESHIQTMRTDNAAAAGIGDMDELFQIIHRPGWTTPAEVAFLLNSLESINAQAKQLRALRQGLLAAAKVVHASLRAQA